MRAFLVVLALFARVVAFDVDYFFWTCEDGVVESPTIKCVLEGEEYEAYYTCLCKDRDFYLSILECINRFSAKAESLGLAKAKKAIKSSDKEGRRFCKRYYHVDIEPSLAEAQQYLSTHELPLLSNDTIGPFALPDESYSDHETRRSIDSHYQQWAPEQYGQGTLYYVFGIMFVQIVVNLLGWFVPTAIRVGSNNVIFRNLRQYFFLPATFRKHRARPVRAFPGVYFGIPPRMHTVLIVGFYVLHIVFTCINYPVILSANSISERYAYLGEWIGYRSGVLGMYCMPLLWLFASRNNFLIWLTGWQYEVFQHWHRWISRMFTIQILVHAIAWTVEEKDYLSETWKQGYWIWGFVATFLMVFMCFQASKKFRMMAYDLFVFLHVLSAVFVVIGTYYHLKYVDMCLEELYTCIAVWGFDRVTRVARVILANPAKTNATLCAHEGDVLELTIPYSKIWKLRAGNYIFVHFWDPLRFWQSHPFTVMEPAKAEEEGTIKLYAKARGGMTKRMYQQAFKEGKPLQHRVFLDGPYGVEFNIKPFRETVLVAGGIGITAVYSHLISYAPKLPEHIFYVHWVMMDELPLKWFQHEIAKMQALSNVQLVLYIDGPNSPLEVTSSNGSGNGSASNDSDNEKKATLSKTGSTNSSIEKYWMRPNFVEVVSNHITNSQGPICIFVCGPDVISDDVRYAAAQGISLSKNFVQYYEESFTM